MQSRQPTGKWNEKRCFPEKHKLCLKIQLQHEPSVIDMYSINMIHKYFPLLYLSNIFTLFSLYTFACRNKDICNCSFLIIRWHFNQIPVNQVKKTFGIGGKQTIYRIKLQVKFFENPWFVLPAWFSYKQCSHPAQGKGVDSCQFRAVWRCLVQLGSSTVKDCRAGAASPFLWTLSPLLAANPSADGLKGAIWPWRWGPLPCQQASEPIWRCVSLDWKIFPIRKVD